MGRFQGQKGLRINFNYARLFRLDVALIAFVSYLVGSELGGGSDVEDIGVALLVMCVSTNAIYSFNAWADRHVDSINKPGRAIPSGKVKPRNACVYALILLILSAVYPFFVFKSSLTLALFLLLPVLGILYSAKPFRLRRYPWPSVVIVSTGLITPVMLGYFMNAQSYVLAPFFLVLYLYCLSVVPLKDIEDMEGDRASGIDNLFSKWGKGLLLLSASGLSITLLSAVLINMPWVLKVGMLIFIVSSTCCIFLFILFRIDLRKLYRTIIVAAVIQAAVLYIILRAFR